MDEIRNHQKRGDGIEREEDYAGSGVSGEVLLAFGSSNNVFALRIGAFIVKTFGAVHSGRRPQNE
jgi:hypothetical protein